ncbi:MAG: Hsp20/alpha crystallin family protein [Flavobacteriales bacterium]|nr:Hsp20/alpha crystallin family protein [Flavobacteriales bacterium]
MSTLIPTRKSLLSRFFDDDAFGFPEGFLDDDRFMPARLFERPFFKEMKMPAVNIQDNTDHFAIDLAVPGFKKDDLKVQLKDGVLTISSERKAEHEEEKKGYTRKEWSFASFSRAFVLPENTDADSLKAKYDDGVLKLTLKKTKAATESKAKEIKIG